MLADTEYVVIEIAERDVVSVTPAKNREDAIEIANGLLKAHMENVDCMDEYESGEEIGAEWAPAKATSDCAWCNYSGNWDAHVHKLTKKED